MCSAKSLSRARGGSYSRVENFRDKYLDELTKGHKLSRPIKVTVACGNGTAGLFAPEALRRIGAEVTESECNPDYNFPNYNPNTEDLHMLDAMAKALKANGSEIALGFDADGDRCGVVDDKGEEIFADKIGVLLARDMSSKQHGAKFVADVKSTGIFEIDPILKENGATTDYWITGHSYMKRRCKEIGALCGFEKSGHYYLCAPLGRGMTMASSPASRYSRCSTARAPRRCPTSWPACQDLELAHDGARMPRRQEIRRRRCDGEGVSGRREERRTDPSARRSRSSSSSTACA